MNRQKPQNPSRTLNDSFFLAASTRVALLARVIEGASNWQLAATFCLMECVSVCVLPVSSDNMQELWCIHVYDGEIGSIKNNKVKT